VHDAHELSAPSNPYCPHGVQKAEYIHQPYNNDDDHYSVQYRFDGTGHRYVPVDEAKKNTDDDQHSDKLKQRHDV
jgi:hypothetical protein